MYGKVFILSCLSAFTFNYVNCQVPVGLNEAKAAGFERLELRLKEIIPDVDAVELVQILKDYSTTENETAMVDGATRLVLFALQDRVHVDRDKLFEILNADSGSTDATTITSIEFREFEDELTKVMPATFAHDIGNIFSKLYGVTSKTLPDFLIDFLDYSIPRKMKLSKKEYYEKKELNHDTGF